MTACPILEPADEPQAARLLPELAPLERKTMER